MAKKTAKPQYWWVPMRIETRTDVHVLAISAEEAIQKAKALDWDDSVEKEVINWDVDGTPMLEE